MGYSRAKVNMSVRESDLFALLSHDPQTTLELLQKYYGRKARPFNARAVITGRLRSISDKLDHNRDGVVIRKSPRAGPNPISYWLEPRHG